MSGTIPLSMTQQMDQYGDPLAGGRLYFFVAGTVSTFQNAYQDGALTLEHPNPITLDATGRVPQFFLADGLIKIRLTDDAGVVQLVADNIAVIGSSSGGGGGGGLSDATTVAQTGDLKPRYGTGTHTGWVRCNGRTIGSSVSGATELPSGGVGELNSTQALFEYLWNTDPTLVVVGGRGLNANDDWVANKQLTLPDLRGRVIAGMDDMGSTAANRLNASYFGADGETLGAVGGSDSHTLLEVETPIGLHQHYNDALAGGGTGSGSATSGGIDHQHGFAWGGTAGNGGLDHTHPTYRYNTTVKVAQDAGGVDVPYHTGGRTQDEASGNASQYLHGHGYSGSDFTGLVQGGTAGYQHTHPVNVTSLTVATSGWSDTAQWLGNAGHANVQHTMVCTIYIKL